MISLMQLLKEVQGKPVAILLAGAPGAGKGSVLRDLDLSGLKTLNLDDTIAALSKTDGFTLNQKAADAEDRSKFMKAMATATKKLKGEQIPQAIANGESFILDGTSASKNQTIKLTNELKEAGYEVMMLYVYTDLERSLKQNERRFEKSGGEDRSLAPAIVMRTWKSVTENLPKYADLFGFNFVAVANTLDDRMQDIDKIINKYLKPFTPTGTKPKTPDQQKKSDERKAKDKEEIQAMLADDFIYDVIEYTMSKEEAQMRLKQFLSK